MGRFQSIQRDGVETSDDLRLPHPAAEVLPGIPWGRHDCLFTPAYWAAQAFHYADELDSAPIRLGSTLLEEVAACLLGGHGAQSEVGLAAFDAVRSAALLNGERRDVDDILAVLGRPLPVRGRSVRYRFAKRRSRYLAAAIEAIGTNEITCDSHAKFRAWLTGIDGIGLKTASWITRNWLDSDCVAVLDIHLLRAGSIMGIFSPDSDVNRDYLSLERAFLDFADAIAVRASRLDALIWRQMKYAGPLAVRAAARLLQSSDEQNTLLAA